MLRIRLRDMLPRFIGRRLDLAAGRALRLTNRPLPRRGLKTGFFDIVAYPSSCWSSLRLVPSSALAQRGCALVFIVNGCHRHWRYNISFLQFLLVTYHMTFDFHCRYGLFTYSQCAGLDPWHVLDKFSEIGAECIIAREAHADGGTHLHVFADWGRRKRFRRHDFADVDSFHPNIVPSRGTPHLGWDYATKDGDIVAGGLERPGGSGDSLLRKDQIWDQIMDAVSREQFFELVRELAPADLAKSFPSLVKYADWRYAEPIAAYEGPTFGDIRFDLSPYPGLEQWCNELRQGSNGQPGTY